MLLTTVLAFIVALGLLIAVHEWGHYRMAVACGVKVLRFSVGFGKTIYRWQPRHQKNGQNTEFVIGAFPLGGYVKMLDEREGEVPPADRARAFNNQPLRARAAIVAAGPAANLVLAVLLYACVNWIGSDQPLPILASPPAGSLAQQAGIVGGETVLRARFDGDASVPRSFDDLRWHLTQGALNKRDIELTLRTPGAGEGGAERSVRLPLSRVDSREADLSMFRAIGIIGPLTEPLLGDILPGGAAERAGLRSGDRVLNIGGQTVVDGQQLRELIRASVRDGQPLTQAWRIERAGQTLLLDVTPQVVQQGAAPIGRIDALVGAPPAMVHVSDGPVQGLWNGVVKSWEISLLSLRMMGRMLVGDASLKNLSGPLTIADYAGKSASLGLIQYLTFLALISVSLGVLNLLPLPVLDGGHLMYYLWEGVTGRNVSDAWMQRMQRGGVALLLVMMSIALFNDVVRIFG